MDWTEWQEQVKEMDSMVMSVRSAQRLADRLEDDGMDF